MAIHPELIASPAAQEQERVLASYDRVEAWTVAQTADILSATHITSPSPRVARGTSVTIDIPLDDDDAVREQPPPRPRPEAVHTVYKRREPIRRDSLKRREALLKGKEGSRRRQRWENDRLLNNPHAEPPLPSDWEVRPTHTVHRPLPYVVLPLYEAEYKRYEKERLKKAEAARVPASKEEAVAAKVAQELRTKLKKSKGAKNLLQDLEEDVRSFVRQWEQKQKEMEADGLVATSDSEDEEIVFVGRDGAMSDERKRERQRETLEKDKMIFQGILNDHGSAFGRYLVHAIAAYYGLKTWSVTNGDLREAYVGLKTDPKTRRPSLTRDEMPRPLYAVV